ncbi:MAG: hypothetical protein DWI22_12195 [Planctomycetota bacterium]|nr:MAG: hypothetical protein DWI22_12195 [Planctomycetota bacterium]
MNETVGVRSWHILGCDPNGTQFLLTAAFGNFCSCVSSGTAGPRRAIPMRCRIRRKSTIRIAHFFAARLRACIGVLTPTEGTETLP